MLNTLRSPGRTAIAVALAGLLPAAAALACPGDCNDDCQVDVSELVVGIRIALGQQTTDACARLDQDTSGSAAVDELVTAVDAALNGCTGRLSFEPPVRYATGDSPRSLAAGDLDGDGWIDVAAANHISHDVSVLLNDGAGALRPEARFATGRIPLGIVIADFDGDEHADLATADGEKGEVSVLLGAGDGTFVTEPPIPAGANARTILATDVDTNGTVDLIVAAPGINGIPLLLGRGDGSFDRLVVGAGFQPWWVAYGDVTGDAIADLVTANAETSDLTILAGAAAGGFVGRSRLELMEAPYSVAIADVDADGDADLLTGNGADASVTLLRGQNGTFTISAAIDVGRGPYPVHVADIDADGNLDVVTPNELSADVSIRRGNGDATFGPDLRFAVGPSPYALALADLDRDGLLDLIAATGAADQVAVRRRNRCSATRMKKPSGVSPAISDDEQGN